MVEACSILLNTLRYVSKLQVEAALTTSPDDAELLKLKKDLEEVIELTTELIKSQLPDDVKKEGWPVSLCVLCYIFSVE